MCVRVKVRRIVKGKGKQQQKLLKKSMEKRKETRKMSLFTVDALHRVVYYSNTYGVVIAAQQVRDRKAQT